MQGCGERSHLRVASHPDVHRKANAATGAALAGDELEGRFSERNAANHVSPELHGTQQAVGTTAW